MSSTLRLKLFREHETSVGEAFGTMTPDKRRGRFGSSKLLNPSFVSHPIREMDYLFIGLFMALFHVLFAHIKAGNQHHVTLHYSFRTLKSLLFSFQTVASWIHLNLCHCGLAESRTLGRCAGSMSLIYCLKACQREGEAEGGDGGGEGEEEAGQRS